MSKQEWINLDDDGLRKLDLRRFNQGRSPYAEHDTSLDAAYRDGRQYHEDMVSWRTGMAGGKRVLDLLCGFGRWSPFLAEVSDEVIGIDQVHECIELARNYCAWCECNNASFLEGDWHIVNKYSPRYFDRVWIWSGLQYIHRCEALAEVNRLLEPGGRLFVGAYNSTGIMIQHVLDGARHQRINEGSSQWALSALVHGPDWDGYPNYITLDACHALCSRFGFELIAVAPQGCIDVSRPSGLIDGCKGTVLYDHHPRTVEFVAEKVRDITAKEAISASMDHRDSLHIRLCRWLVRRFRTGSTDDK